MTDIVEIKVRPKKAAFSMTQCNQLTTDGGSLLLCQADRKVGLRQRLQRCVQDKRDPERIEYRLQEVLVQGSYGLALGYGWSQRKLLQIEAKLSPGKPHCLCLEPPQQRACETCGRLLRCGIRFQTRRTL